MYCWVTNLNALTTATVNSFVVLTLGQALLLNYTHTHTRIK